MSDTASSPSLVEKPVEKMDRPQPVIVRVAKEHGVSPFAQLFETTKLRFGASKLASNEYYDMGLFRISLSASEKPAFVGETRNEALNRSLSSSAVATQNDLVENKLGFGVLLAKHGLGAPETQAVFAGEPDFEGCAVLRTEAEFLIFCPKRPNFPHLANRERVQKRGFSSVF